MNTCYVATTIPYVNARPHVGFALELVQADVIARWNRNAGIATRFLTGTDENASKNVRTAEGLGIPTRDLCTRNSAAFESLVSLLDISADRFIRTSSAEHHRSATRFWQACYRKVGFKEEGRLREDRFANARYEDVLMMAILRSEWASASHDN